MLFQDLLLLHVHCKQVFNRSIHIYTNYEYVYDLWGFMVHFFASFKIIIIRVDWHCQTSRDAVQLVATICLYDNIKKIFHNLYSNPFSYKCVR